MGWSSSVCVWGQLSTDGLVIVQLRAVFCPSVQYLLFFCEAFSWMILDSSRCPLFHSSQVFHKLLWPFSVVLPQNFFNLTTLFSYPVFFCLFHARFDAVVHFLVFLRSFRFKSFLSQQSIHQYLDFTYRTLFLASNSKPESISEAKNKIIFTNGIDWLILEI